MKAIRPRETRLWIDDARAEFARSPFVMKVTNRRIGANGEEMDIELYQIKNFDIEFANNFFYPNNTGKGAVSMMMVPFALNGDE